MVSATGYLLGFLIVGLTGGAVHYVVDELDSFLQS
jgi:hypothetical protein